MTHLVSILLYPFQTLSKHADAKLIQLTGPAMEVGGHCRHSNGATWDSLANLMNQFSLLQCAHIRNNSTSVLVLQHVLAQVQQ